MSAPKTRDPLAVTTRDGMQWVRRAVTQDGRGLYAPEGVCSCPEFVMATLAELAEHGIRGRDPVADAVAVMGALPVPLGPDEPAVDKTHALIAAAIGEAKPARDGVLVSLAQSVKDRAEHDHPRVGEDLYCWNLSGYMGDRMAPVLRRLVDAESERDAWHDWADSLAYKVAPVEVLGRHGEEGRFPWSDALDLITPAAEVEQLRARVAELEAELRIGAPWKCHVCGKDNRRDVCVICETDRPDPHEMTRPVDEDPIAYSLTVEALHASSGAVIETPSRREQSTAKLRGILARQRAAIEDAICGDVNDDEICENDPEHDGDHQNQHATVSWPAAEAPHETPPRPRPTPHDLPEVTP